MSSPKRCSLPQPRNLLMLLSIKTLKQAECLEPPKYTQKVTGQKEVSSSWKCFSSDQRERWSGRNSTCPSGLKWEGSCRESWERRCSRSLLAPPAGNTAPSTPSEQHSDAQAECLSCWQTTTLCSCRPLSVQQFVNKSNRKTNIRNGKLPKIALQLSAILSVIGFPFRQEWFFPLCRTDNGCF